MNVNKRLLSVDFVHRRVDFRTRWRTGSCWRSRTAWLGCWRSLREPCSRRRIRRAGRTCSIQCECLRCSRNTYPPSSSACLPRNRRHANAPFDKPSRFAPAGYNNAALFNLGGGYNYDSTSIRRPFDCYDRSTTYVLRPCAGCCTAV